jgi:hypothetical protein
MVKLLHQHRRRLKMTMRFPFRANQAGKGYG